MNGEKQRFMKRHTSADKNLTREKKQILIVLTH